MSNNSVISVILKDTFKLNSLKIRIDITDNNYQFLKVPLNKTYMASLFYVSIFFVTNTSTIPPAVKPIEKSLIDFTKYYRGCFRERPDAPDLNGNSFSNLSVSIESCIYYCKLEKFRFVALQSR